MTINLAQEFEYTSKFISCVSVDNSFVFSTDEEGLLIVVRISPICIQYNFDIDWSGLRLFCYRKSSRTCSDRLQTSRYLGRQSHSQRKNRLKIKILKKYVTKDQQCAKNTIQQYIPIVKSKQVYGLVCFQLLDVLSKLYSGKSKNKDSQNYFIIVLHFGSLLN